MTNKQVISNQFNDFMLEMGHAPIGTDGSFYVYDDEYSDSGKHAIMKLEDRDVYYNSEKICTIDEALNVISDAMLHYTNSCTQEDNDYDMLDMRTLSDYLYGLPALIKDFGTD